MPFAHQKLEGLDHAAVLAAVEPVLRAHRVAGVSIVWQRDHRGWSLSLTVEDPESTDPGAGVTLDLCGEISRDLSAALDVADAVPVAYRLEVGSPGIERPLYGPGDYERFRGKLARLKLTEPVEGQFVLRGVLGATDGAALSIDTDWGEKMVPLAIVESGRLVFEFGSDAGPGRGRRPHGKQRSARGPKAAPARGSR